MSTLNVNGSKQSLRTSSHRSIYEYPEHLNPFYEEENHKRLRFWRINGDHHDDGGKKLSRSNSFSLDGLKGLWSFKSFRLKKKSSTLGINKTSESPPVLRHYNHPSAAADVHARHTIDVGLANNFQRGTPYRASLQDLNSRDQQAFFVRNHRYRNTVQNGNLASESQLRASTPALQMRYVRPSMSHGSSQTSVNSTNPFEDDSVDTVSQAGSIDGVSIRSRKKRRAPQPPTSPIKSTMDKSIVIVEETPSEKSIDLKCTESVEIINLTAEIESFVKTAATNSHVDTETDDQEQPKSVDDKRSMVNGNGVMRSDESKQSRQSPESNDFYGEDEHASDKLTSEEIQNLGDVHHKEDYVLLNNYERNKRSPVKILIREPTEEDNETIPITTDHIESSACADANDNEAKVVGVVEKTLPHISITLNDVESKEFDAIPDRFRDEQCNTPTSLEVENILENEKRFSLNSTSSLRITESCDDLVDKVNSESSKSFEVTNIPLETSPLNSPKTETIPDATKSETTAVVNSRFEIRTVPLKDFSPVAIRKNSIEYIVTNGTTGKKVPPPTPPRRSRTVKEIIESINKSQSLLKMNQDKKKAEEKITTMANSQPDRNMNDATEKNVYEQKKLFGDATDLNGNRTMMTSNEFNDEDIPLCVARYNEVSKNNSILFKKCVAARYRSANETNQRDEKASNVDWNPVPKPRRHKHSP